MDAPKFKDYILTLVFLKRLSDVFDDEIAHRAEEFGNKKTVLKRAKKDYKLIWSHISAPAPRAEVARKTPGLVDLSYAENGRKDARNYLPVAAIALNALTVISGKS